MTTVGIIANPAAGKDVRRLVAHASVFDNNEKVNIVRRVLLGLDASGVDHVVLMPDSFSIGAKAVRALRHADLSLTATVLDMPTTYSPEDSTVAARRMREMNVGCIVTLGGDGTNRAVSKGCGQIPLVPISTGTNNAFPQMIEGTIGGLAAGVVAREIVDPAEVVHASLCLEVHSNGSLVDMALIDAVVVDQLFVGSRAIWDVATVRQIVLARGQPHGVGFSSVGGNLPGMTLGTHQGLAIEIGPGELEVLASVAPGVVRWMPVEAYTVLGVGDSVLVSEAPAVLALDGERQIELYPEDRVEIRLSDAGPSVVDIPAALRRAVDAGFFVRDV